MSEDTTTPEPIQPFIIQSWTRSIIRPTLIILMVAALMGAIFSVAALIDPNRIWAFGFLVCFFVILESYFTTSWLNHPKRRNLNHLQYRAAEIIVIALIIRFLTWAIQGNWPEIQAWLNYLKNPFALFNDSYFWTSLVLSLIAWQRTLAISQSFRRMKPDEAELAYYSLPRQERIPGNQPISYDRSHLLRDFIQQFMGGGIIMLICAALASFNLSEFPTVGNPFTSGLTRLGLSANMLVSLMLYFLCGFLLLSQGRLAILEMRWLVSSVTQQTPIGRHWHRRTLFLLLAMGLIAAFLPVGSTLPFARILNLILYGIMVSGTIILHIFSLLLYLILLLFFPKQAATEEAPPPPPPPPPLQQLPQSETNDTLQYIFSSAFWSIAFIMSIIAFSFFLKDRGVKINSVGLQRIWLTLKLWWQQLWQGVADQIQDIQGSLQSAFQKDSKQNIEKQIPFRFVRINALSPREKIYYFYLSTIKRANQRGVARKKSETPLEFVDDLKTNWPDAEEEIEELTEAFLQARYSPASIKEDDITPIKKQWKRLKSNLRKRKKRTGKKSLREDGESS